MARPSDRTELTFLISHRVLKSAPGRRTLTLASTRMEPSSIFASDAPIGHKDRTELGCVGLGLIGMTDVWATDDFD